MSGTAVAASMAVEEAEDVPPSSPTTSFTAGKDFEDAEIEPFVFEDVRLHLAACHPRHSCLLMFP